MGRSSPSCIQRSKVMDSQSGGRPYPFKKAFDHVCRDSSSSTTRISNPSGDCIEPFISSRSIAMPGVPFEKPKPWPERAGSQSDGFRCGSIHHVKVFVPLRQKYSMVSSITDLSSSLYGWEQSNPLNQGCGSAVCQRVNCLFSKCSGLLRLRYRKKSHILARMAMTSA